MDFRIGPDLACTTLRRAHDIVKICSFADVSMAGSYNCIGHIKWAL